MRSHASPKESSSSAARPFFSRSSDSAAATTPFFVPARAAAAPDLQAQTELKEPEEKLQRKESAEAERDAPASAPLPPEEPPAGNVQTKLAMGAPGDRFEREADVVADSVVQRMESGEDRNEALNEGLPSVQMKCTACEEERKLQRREERKEESIGTGPVPLQAKCACQEEGVKLQPKLTIGKPGDRYEQEADSMANAVMRTSEPAGALASGLRTTEVQRMPITPVSASLLQRDADESCNLKDEPVEEGEEENEETEDVEAIPAAEKPVSPKREAGEVSPPPDLESRLDASRGGGSSLPASTREFMESRFDHDFSAVRVHSGANAEQLNRDVRSLAFTSGSDIYFGSGQYRPDTDSGQHLLAHELTHVVQQNGSGGNGPVREKADPRVIRRAELPEHKWYYSHRVSGTAVHGILGNILHKANTDKNLVTEAAIAGANRNEEGLNKIGIADLYTSTPKRTVTGVKAYRNLDSEDDIVSMDSPKVNETRPLKEITSSPTFKKGEWKGDFPSEILLGEIKPWNTLKAADGWAQLDHYKQGYSKFVEKMSKVNKGKTRSSITFGRLNVTLPPWLDFDNWQSQHTNHVDSKPAHINDRRLWVARIDPGVYLYTDFAKGYEGPPPELFSQHLTQMRTVREHMKTPHPRTDKMGQGKFIQRHTKDRPANYWPEKGRAWEKERAAFSKPFRAALKTSLKGWREKARFEKKLGRSGRTQPNAEKKEVKDYKDLMFWSGTAGKFLGKIRFLLGGAWDKALGIFEKMKEKMTGIRTKVKGLKEGGLVKSSWGSRLIQVVVAACKVAFSSFITESFNFFADCFHSAMDKLVEKFQTELNERFGKEMCEARKLFEDSKAKLETEWGESIKQIERLVEAVQDVKYWTDIATTAVDLIRVGVQIISCLSPPGLGCLWGLVAQLGIGAMVGLVIGTQWFADEIVTPNVRKLVRTYIAPYYQKMINSVLGEGLKEYHCAVADDAIPSMEFKAKATIDDAALRAHRDSWESEFEPQLLKDLQEVFGKPGGKKPTKEELLELVKKMQESKLSMQELKDRKTMQALLQQSLDPKTGKLKLEDAKKQAEKTEAPTPLVKERTIDYPKARKQNPIFQKMRGWDPTLFVKKPGIKVDTDEFADAVYDMQEALKIKADGILGDDTVIAFYDKNKKKKDIFYEESVQANEERKQKEQEAKDKATADKAAKDKGGVAPPALPASVKVLNASTLVPDEKGETVPSGINIQIPDFWSLMTWSDSPKSFKEKSSPPYVTLDVYVNKKHEFRIEYVAVKKFYVANMIGGGSCYWTAVLQMEDGFKLETANGKLVKFETQWCLSPD